MALHQPSGFREVFQLLAKPIHQGTGVLLEHGEQCPQQRHIAVSETKKLKSLFAFRKHHRRDSVRSRPLVVNAAALVFLRAHLIFFQT